MSISGMERAEVRPGRGKPIQFLYSMPEHAAAISTFPLVLFLHGAGERGDDLASVQRHGLPKLAALGRRFPFILVAPQCRADEVWTPAPLVELLDALPRMLPIDPNRIVCTGLSLGGYAAWMLGSLLPSRFAAVVPVCGWGDAKAVTRLRNTPVWTFHGERDLVVPAERTRLLVNSLTEAGGNVRFTAYPDLGHDCWSAAYDTGELYSWLQSHQRPASRL
jgi:predicted peptidase